MSFQTGLKRNLKIFSKGKKLIPNEYILENKIQLASLLQLIGKNKVKYFQSEIKGVVDLVGPFQQQLL